MIYGYLRTSRTAVDGLADAGVEGASIFQDVGSSGSVPVSDRPGWTQLDTRLRRGDTVTVAALDRISRNRVDLVGVVESLHRRGVGIASLAPAESWLHPLSTPPHRGRTDDGGDNPAGDGLGRPSGTGVDQTPHSGGHSAGG